MTFLENYGVSKIKQYFKKIKQSQPKEQFTNLKELFKAKKIRIFILVAFMLGTILTFPLIWLELTLNVFDLKHLIWNNILIYIGAIIILVGLEFYLLFLLGFYLVAWYIYHISKMNYSLKNQINDEKILLSLSRAVMELPEHKEEDNMFDIIHERKTDKKLLVWSIMYKAKVVVSNFLLKFVARKVMAKTSFRVYSPYVATIGTGFWDAVVFYLSVKEIQHKITTRYMMRKILEHDFELMQSKETIKAIQYRYQIYGEFNANLHFLLDELHNSDIKSEKINDTYFKYIQALPREIQVILFAVKKGHTKKKEKEIIQILDIKEDIRKVKSFLVNGETDKIDKILQDVKGKER